MASSLPPMPAPPANSFVRWVKRHKVWSGIIGVFALLFLIGLVAPDQQATTALSTGQPSTPATSSSSATLTPSPSPVPITVKVPAVVGSPLDQAMRKLKGAGLRVDGRTKR